MNVESKELVMVFVSTPVESVNGRVAVSVAETFVWLT